jgi:hypothetical protein
MYSTGSLTIRRKFYEIPMAKNAENIFSHKQQGTSLHEIHNDNGVKVK